MEVNGTDLSFQVKELKPPHGQGRVTKPEDGREQDWSTGASRRWRSNLSDAQNGLAESHDAGRSNVGSPAKGALTAVYRGARQSASLRSALRSPEISGANDGDRALQIMDHAKPLKSSPK